MKKIGIITICDYKNYGNRLQNFALQEVLKSLGFEVETIVNNPLKKSDDKKKQHKKVFSAVKQTNYRTFFNKLFNKLNKRKNFKALEKKKEVFKEFTNYYIKETSYIITNSNIPLNINNAFDYFVVGSDQVWNPIYRNGSSIDFLTFAPKNKRVAYAPSFGISSIPEGQVTNYKKWLSEIEFLSVRENSGAKIIKELTGRKAPVLIDPTLMLTKEKWLSIAKPSFVKPKVNYLLTYFLGELTKEKANEIKEIAKKYDLEVVNLASYRDRKYYSVSPDEFIDFVTSSSLFMTDSFHGAVFSILLQKPFIVFNRVGKAPAMNSRIDTLLSKFQLEDRKWDVIKNRNNILQIDFSHVDSILEVERNKSITYLQSALRN